MNTNKSKKVKSQLVALSNNIDKRWKDNNLSFERISTELSKDKEVNQFLKECNRIYGSRLTIAGLSGKKNLVKILKFAHDYQLNSVELNAEETNYIVKPDTRKEYFTMKFVINVLKRKAKYKTPNSPEFIKYANECKVRKVCKMIEQKAKETLIAQLLEENDKLKGVKKVA